MFLTFIFIFYVFVYIFFDFWLLYDYCHSDHKCYCFCMFLLLLLLLSLSLWLWLWLWLWSLLSSSLLLLFCCCSCCFHCRYSGYCCCKVNNVLVALAVIVSIFFAIASVAFAAFWTFNLPLCVVHLSDYGTSTRHHGGDTQNCKSSACQFCMKRCGIRPSM